MWSDDYFCGCLHIQCHLCPGLFQDPGLHAAQHVGLVPSFGRSNARFCCPSHSQWKTCQMMNVKVPNHKPNKTATQGLAAVRQEIMITRRWIDCMPANRIWMSYIPGNIVASRSAQSHVQEVRNCQLNLLDPLLLNKVDYPSSNKNVLLNIGSWWFLNHHSQLGLLPTVLICPNWMHELLFRCTWKWILDMK